MKRSSVLEIDLDAVGRNIMRLQSILQPGTTLCPVIKADGYGLGARAIARSLAARGVDLFAVFGYEEALSLVKGGVRSRLLVLQPVVDAVEFCSDVPPHAFGAMEFTCQEDHHLDVLSRIAQERGERAAVHIEVDTGMCRSGFQPADLPPALERMAAESDRFRLVGLCTHFANTDVTSCREQLGAFTDSIGRHRTLIPRSCTLHAASTAAAVLAPEFQLDMVRCGIGWAGYAPVPTGSLSLEGVVEWRSRIIHAKSIEAGECVGYGGRWVAQRETRVGLVPVGYADGYPSALGAASGERCGEVMIESGGRSCAAPVIGAVNMDQITIDLTGIPHADADVGSPVTILSRGKDGPNSVCETARRAGILPHELLSRIGPRVRRRYLRTDAQMEGRSLSGARTSANLAVFVQQGAPTAEKTG